MFIEKNKSAVKLVNYSNAILKNDKIASPNKVDILCRGISNI